MTAVEDEVPATQRPRRVVIAPPRSVRPRRVLHSRAPALPSSGPTAQHPRAKATDIPFRAADLASPTTDIRHVMKVLLIGIMVAVLFGANGLVHAGKGMDLGLERSIVLALGEPLQAVTSAVGITLPWDLTARALGRSTNLDNAPLLASAGTQSSKQHRQIVLPRLPAPSRAHPLRLLVTGDSLTEYLGPQLADEATQVGPVKAFSDTHYGTGIVRPDFVDWSMVAQQQVRSEHPEAVVVFMGGNDNQNIQLPDGKILDAGTPAWTAEYARRVAVCMRIWSQGGRARVYWLSMPPARSDSWSATNRQINVAIRRAAKQVPRARFLDVLAPVTDHGQYADFVTVGGQPTLVRTPDGIHFNSTGSTIVSHEVLSLLVRDWHLGDRQPARSGLRAAPTATSSSKQ